MIITKFDKKICNALSDEAVVELAAWATKNGLNISYGGGKFSDIEFKLTMTLKVADVQSRDAAAKKNWDDQCDYFHLLPSDRGITLTIRGEAYTVVGLSSRVKFPFICRHNVTGKETVFSEVLADRIRASR